MKSTAYHLRQMVFERIGPGPGPEEFVIEELSPGIYAWHLNREGELISPLQAPLEWKAYAKKATDVLKRPGTGVVMWDAGSGR